MTPKKVKPRFVEVEFLDHCVSEGSNVRPIPCVVVGTLVGECKDAWYVASWLAEGQVDDNMTSFTILKKVVTKMTTLYRGGKSHAKNKKARSSKH